MLGNFVTVLEVAVAKRAQLPEVRVVDEQFVARGDINLIAVESNAAQAAIPATASPVNIGGIPVQYLVNGLRCRIDNKDAAVTFALLTAAYDGCRDQRRNVRYCLYCLFHRDGNL